MNLRGTAGMKLAGVYDHHNASNELKRRDNHDWITDVFEAPAVKIGPRCTQSVRKHVSDEFHAEGWAWNVKISNNTLLSITALKDDLAFQLQTGNISRAPYDLLKLQYLFQCSKIECAALAVPTKEAAQKIGSNIANADRIWNELQLFDRVITVPILLIAFE